MKVCVMFAIAKLFLRFSARYFLKYLFLSIAKLTDVLCLTGRFYLCEGTFRNYGKGKSKEMAAAKRSLDAGVNLRKLADVEFDLVIRHRRNLQWYRDEVVPVPCRAIPRGVFFYGPPGVGKTQHVLSLFPPSDDVFWFNCSPKNGAVWWEGYDRHKTVVFNDFNAGSFGLGVAGFEYAKQVFDSAPFRVAVHGGLVPLCAEFFVFTANRSPRGIFAPEYTKELWDDFNPVKRRFDFFEHTLMWQDRFGEPDPDWWEKRGALPDDYDQRQLMSSVYHEPAKQAQKSTRNKIFN
jgi:hypothetical protein